MARPRLDASDPRTWTREALAADDSLRTEEGAPTHAPPISPDPVAELTKHWKKAYERAARRHEKTLLSEHQGATASERIVLAAAAKDFAVGDSLWRSIVQLSARVEALVDNPRHVVALARALKEVVACRSAATARAEQMLTAAATLRAQRRIVNLDGKPALRRVV